MTKQYDSKTNFSKLPYIVCIQMGNIWEYWLDVKLNLDIGLFHSEKNCLMVIKLNIITY